jgi:subtilase family serine protease
MHSTRTALALTLLASFTAACSGGPASAVSPAMPNLARQNAVHSIQPLAGIAFVHACATLQLGDDVLCDALVRTDVRSTELNPHALVGLTPSDLHKAYNIPATGGTGRTIGIVDAQDNPNAESDLGKYRAHFHLPPCTTANKCFRKINQKGIAGKYPSVNTGWGEEISLDLDMASAVCPACHILLVEATSPSFANLGASVDTAIAHGASVVSNSYTGVESAAADKHYDHKGIPIIASSGDGSFSTGPLQPASFATVVAVGGTTLVADPGPRGWTESAWSAGGAGCSQLVPKPAWQHDKGCANRTLVDVSAVADPATGVAVFDTLGTGSTWLLVGGTSVSAPIVASLFALSGNTSTSPPAENFWKGGGHDLYDTIAGSDGECFPFYLCTSGPGYDAPTGWGTPNGLGAF